MKVSSNLLKAIALGVSLGAAVSSCSLIEEVFEEDQIQVCNENCEAQCTVHAKANHDNCPACGMG